MSTDESIEPAGEHQGPGEDFEDSDEESRPQMPEMRPELQYLWPRRLSTQDFFRGERKSTEAWTGE